MDIGSLVVMDHGDMAGMLKFQNEDLVLARNRMGQMAAAGALTGAGAGVGSCFWNLGSRCNRLSKMLIRHHSQ